MSYQAVLRSSSEWSKPESLTRNFSNFNQQLFNMTSLEVSQEHHQKLYSTDSIHPQALDSQVKAVISKNKLSSSAVDSIVKLALDNVAVSTASLNYVYRSLIVQHHLLTVGYEFDHYSLSTTQKSLINSQANFAIPDRRYRQRCKIETQEARQIERTRRGQYNSKRWNCGRSRNLWKLLEETRGYLE